MTKQEAIEWIKAHFLPDEHGLTNTNHDVAMGIAIECIEKQTPKEAKCHVSGNGWYGWIEFTCPVCGKKFKDSLVCPCCYQRVKPLKESDE